MRSLRYELSGAARRRDNFPAAFTHIAVIAEESSGFAALRDVFRKVQRRALPTVGELARLVAGSGWLVRALWWRVVEGRLLAPVDAQFELHQVIEQAPDPENRITLSADRSDHYGVPLPVIDWRIRPADLDVFRQILTLFMRNWRAGKLSCLAEAAERPEHEIVATLTSGGGIYHPGGSTRIGESPRDGVVDGDLRVFRVPNLRVVSTAAFPNGGTANPTLMLMLFAYRAADQIHAELAAGEAIDGRKI